MAGFLETQSSLFGGKDKMSRAAVTAVQMMELVRPRDDADSPFDLCWQCTKERQVVFGNAKVQHNNQHPFRRFQRNAQIPSQNSTPGLAMTNERVQHVEVSLRNFPDALEEFFPEQRREAVDNVNVHVDEASAHRIRRVMLERSPASSS